MAEPRPRPPGLIVRAPDCPLCMDEVTCDGDTFACDTCGASWPVRDPERDGHWDDPDAPQCDATGGYGLTALPCLLAAGHRGLHRAANGHAWETVLRVGTWEIAEAPGTDDEPADHATSPTREDHDDA